MTPAQKARDEADLWAERLVRQQDAQPIREGDVVRLDDGTEGRVTQAVTRSGGVIEYWIDGDCWHRNELTLLRRPVQVGDRLRHPTLGVCDVIGTSPLGAICIQDLGVISEPWRYSWTHADGTPIEPPVSRTSETLPAPAPDADPWARIVDWAAYSDCYTSRPGKHTVVTDHGEVSGEKLLAAAGASALHAPPPTQRSGETALQRWQRETEAVRALAHRQLGEAMYGQPVTQPSSRLDRLLDLKRQHQQGMISTADFLAVIEGEPPLTAERLARCLWRDDPEVVAFVDRVGEVDYSHVCDRCESVTQCPEVDERRARAEQRAWERDELGARTRWTAIAIAAVERLRGGE